MDVEMISNSLNSCLLNNKELMPFKEIFSDSLSTYLYKFKEYQLEPDYDNFCNLLSNLKVDYNNSIENVTSYDKNINTLHINPEKVKELSDLSRIFISPILTMFTYVHNIENEKASLGVTYEENGVMHGEYINEKIDDRIKELFFGNEEVFHKENGKLVETITLPCASDQVCMDIQYLLGEANLFTYYLNGRGDLFFSKMSELFNSPNECIEFIDSVDNLRSHNQKADDEYNKKVEELYAKKQNMTFGSLK